MIQPADDSLFGFTPKLFEGYLWKKGEDIYISFIESKFQGMGFFKKLIDNILAAGYNVRIPTPLGRMKTIVLKNNYKRSIENSELGDVEIWFKTPRGSSD